MKPPSDERAMSDSQKIDMLVSALRQWACPGCGGSGKYQQNAKSRTRKVEQGKPHDQRYEPDPVVCKVCGGLRLHPTARNALAAVGAL